MNDQNLITKGAAPDYEAMWNELFDREDTSLALHEIMKEIKARHTPPGAEKSHTKPEVK